MKQRLLVVDDDRSVLESLTKLLAAEGYDVLAARDGTEALGHFKSGPVDLVVLDLNLGTDDGWDVFQKMAELNPFVPTVIITAECAQRDLARAAGVEALIEKPIDVPVFLKMIRTLLAEPTEEGLKRICGNDEYCRYVTGHHEADLRSLLERYNAPFKWSPNGQYPRFKPAASSTNADAGSVHCEPMSEQTIPTILPNRDSDFCNSSELLGKRGKSRMAHDQLKEDRT